MGLFKSIFGGGGGGKSNAWEDPNLKEYSGNVKSGLYNRLGATQVKNPNYKPPSTTYSSGPMAANGTQSTIFNPRYQYANPNQTNATRTTSSNEPEYITDFSNVGKQVGMNEANSPYDYSGIDSAIDSYKRGPSYTTPKFNFGDSGMIDDQANLEYGLGAKNINRNAQGTLEKLRETVGTRRPGLLLKAGEDSNRNASENLASLNSQLRGNAMGQKLQYGKDQQLAQDDANRYLADLMMKNSDALSSANLNKISAQKEITGDERDYQDRGLEYLMDMYKSMTGAQNQTENAKMADKTNRQGNTLGFLGSAANAAAKAYGR